MVLELVGLYLCPSSLIILFKPASFIVTQHLISFLVHGAAEYLGFEEYTPPFATATDADYLTGLNYASGAGGILNYTNYFVVAKR